MNTSFSLYQVPQFKISPEVHAHNNILIVVKFPANKIFTSKYK